MAELAALQVAASIIQVIDVGIRVIKRLQDFKKNANGLPDAFKHINLRLPLFVDALRQTNAALEDMTDSTRKAFRPAIEECLVQIRKLEITIETVLPKESDRGFARSWKALISVKSESDIKEMDRIIKEYMELMAQHQTSSLALRRSTGKLIVNDRERHIAVLKRYYQATELHSYRFQHVPFHKTEVLSNVTS
jgi:hypothetical protein